MGEWRTRRGFGSDEIADILGDAVEKIAALSVEPRLCDLADALEFVSRGALIVEIHRKAPVREDGMSMSLSDLNNTQIFSTIPNRGQFTQRVCNHQPRTEDSYAGTNDTSR